MADRSEQTDRPQRAPWVEPAPHPLGITVFWLAMAAVVVAMAAVISIVGFEDEDTVRASEQHAAPTTTTIPVNPVDDLDVLLAVLDVPAEERDIARADLLSDDTGEVEAVDERGQETSPPDSAGRVDLQSYGAFRLETDEESAAAFGESGRLACGTLGNEAGTDWSIECVDAAAGASLASPGPVLVVWGFTRLRVAEPDTPATLCTGTLDGGVEASVLVDEDDVVRTLEVQVRGGLDPRSVRAFHVGELWAFVLPITEAAPAWRLSATQVTVGAISSDETDAGGPPPAPPRPQACDAATIAPDSLVVPTTTTTAAPTTTAPTTTEPSPTTGTAPSTTTTVPIDTN